MPSYCTKDFMMSDQITCADNYPIEEYRQYLIQFADLTFKFEGEVKALMVDLTMSSINRVANISLMGCTLDEYFSFPIADRPSPLGFIELTFWRDKGPEVTDIIKKPAGFK